MPMISAETIDQTEGDHRARLEAVKRQHRGLLITIQALLQRGRIEDALLTLKSQLDRS